MNIVDLILSEPEQANSAVAASLQARVFDYLDNYQLAEEESLDEEQLDELSKSTLGSYIKKANDDDSDSKFSQRSKGVASAVKKLDRDGKEDLTGKAMYSRLAKDKGEYTATAGKGMFHRAVDKLTKEDLDEEQITEGWKSGEYVGIADANWVGSNIPAHKKSKTHKYFTHEKTGEILRVDNVTGKQTRNNVTNKELKEDLDEEQLDELSKATLGSYIKKANTSKDKAMNAVDSDEVSDKEWAKGVNTVSKRKDGINKAGSKFISK